MKTVIFYIGVLTLTGCASTSHLVDRGAFAESPSVIGEGQTKEEALKNALVSVPAGYEVEKDGTKSSGCAVAGATPVWSTQAQDYICPSSRYQSLIAVLPKNSVQREQILSARAAAHKTNLYSGGGEDSRSALKNLLQKLPDSAVNDSHSIACTAGLRIDPKTGFSSCTSNPLGNKREATALVIEPKVEKIISVE